MPDQCSKDMTTLRRQAVTNILKKTPSLSTRAAAQEAFNTNPKLFTSVDSARHYARMVRGEKSSSEVTAPPVKELVRTKHERAVAQGGGHERAREELRKMRRNAIREILTLYPAVSTTAAATKALASYPALFSTLDSARHYARVLRGEKKDKDRSAHTDRDLVRTEEEKREALGWISTMPPSRALARTVYEIPYKSALVLPDLHVPYHDEASVRLALEYGVHEKPECVILLGDAMDCADISHFTPRTKMSSLADDLEDLCDMIDYIRNTLGERIPIIYKCGNHDDRFTKYVRAHAPKIADVVADSVGSLLLQRGVNLIWVETYTTMRFGDWKLMHGHEQGRSFGRPVSTSRQLIMKNKMNTMQGHWHYPDDRTERDANGKAVRGITLGCLCDLNPEYTSTEGTNAWGHSFGFLRREGDHVIAKHVLIEDGEIVQQ